MLEYLRQVYSNNPLVLGVVAGKSAVTYQHMLAAVAYYEEETVHSGDGVRPPARTIHDDFAMYLDFLQEPDASERRFPVISVNMRVLTSTKGPQWLVPLLVFCLLVIACKV